ncbi:hypothetical protein OG21DRAFT_1522035 [Imleria badia]|nr:hypothetical protein OG21DRAFT_1522035 [Imleria badia]
MANFIAGKYQLYILDEFQKNLGLSHHGDSERIRPSRTVLFPPLQQPPPLVHLVHTKHLRSECTRDSSAKPTEICAVVVNLIMSLCALLLVVRKGRTQVKKTEVLAEVFRRATGLRTKGEKKCPKESSEN